MLQANFGGGLGKGSEWEPYDMHNRRRSSGQRRRGRGCGPGVEKDIDAVEEEEEALGGADVVRGGKGALGGDHIGSGKW